MKSGFIDFASPKLNKTCMVFISSYYYSLCLCCADVVSCRVVSVLCDPHILQLNCMSENGNIQFKKMRSNTINSEQNCKLVISFRLVLCREIHN